MIVMDISWDFWAACNYEYKKHFKGLGCSDEFVLMYCMGGEL